MFYSNKHLKHIELKNHVEIQSLNCKTLFGLPKRLFIGHCLSRIQCTVIGTVCRKAHLLEETLWTEINHHYFLKCTFIINIFETIPVPKEHGACQLLQLSGGRLYPVDPVL